DRSRRRRDLTRLAFDRAREIGDLRARELARLARAQAPEAERADAHANEPLDAQADGSAHAADLPLPTGAQHHTQTTRRSRAREHIDAVRASKTLLEPDAAPQLRDRRRRELAAHGHLVFTLVAVPRMQDAVGPRAVVVAAYQPFRLRVAAA